MTATPENTATLPRCGVPAYRIVDGSRILLARCDLQPHPYTTNHSGPITVRAEDGRRHPARITWHGGAGV